VRVLVCRMNDESERRQTGGEMVKVREATPYNAVDVECWSVSHPGDQFRA
jgi:hypothetical protein